MKKIVSFIVFITMVLSFSACSSKDTSNNQPASEQTKIDENTQTSGEQTSNTLFEKPTEVSMMLSSAASWPFQTDWYVVKLIKELTNVDLKVEAIPDTGYQDKYNITMASGELPDLMVIGIQDTQRFGQEGAFINILDYADQMPNFKKWSEEHQDEILNNMAADGGLYGFPLYGIAETNRRGWLYREDVFKKLNLKQPTNETEFYDALKALKNEYPDSSPFAFRSSVRQFAMLAPSWGTNAERAYLPDSSKNEWAFGMVEDNFKHMVEYYKNLYEEGLIPTDFLTLDTKGWQDLLSTDKAFVTFDYLGRIDFFNQPMREENPEYTLNYMNPLAFGEHGVAKLPYTTTFGWNMVVSRNSENLDDVLKYIDWMYTDEAIEYLSWGREGESYKVVDGKREWINAPAMADIRKNYGLSTYGMYVLFDFDAHMATFTPELATATVEDQKYDLPRTPVVAFNDEENEVYKTVGAALWDGWQEQISRFIVGDRPMSEWDQYVQEMKDLGLDQYLEIYQNAYQRKLDMLQ